MKNVAILLAAGSGSRMRSEVKKQFICINNRPLMSYSLEAFEHSEVIDSVILVTSTAEIDYCREGTVKADGLIKKRMWRRGWDSNPRALSDKRFSRPPRYDHFDTSP